MRDLLQRIDDYLNTAPRGACDTKSVPPFTLFFRRSSDFAFLNYARPMRPPVGDIGPIIETVRREFRARKRVPRWEFIDEVAPGLAEALVKAGFPTPENRPLMVITAAKFRPRTVDGVTVRPVTIDDDLPSLCKALMRAFSVADEEFSDQVVTDTREMLKRGARFIAAYDGNNPVSAGTHSPIRGTTEIAGIGTAPEFQRRGIGAAVTSALVADAIDCGCQCIFLSAGDEVTAQFYAKLGFETIGTAMDTMEKEVER